jgi:hypothetical protein
MISPHERYDFKFACLNNLFKFKFFQLFFGLLAQIPARSTFPICCGTKNVFWHKVSAVCCVWSPIIMTCSCRSSLLPSKVLIGACRDLTSSQESPILLSLLLERFRTLAAVLIYKCTEELPCIVSWPCAKCFSDIRRTLIFPKLSIHVGSVQAPFWRSHTMPSKQIDQTSKQICHAGFLQKGLASKSGNSGGW